MEFEWDKYVEIADKFKRKAKLQDQQDLKQDIIVKLAEIASNNGHEPFTEGAMVRVASYTVMAYWRDLMRKPTILSLDYESDNGDGETDGLWEAIADDRAIDLDAWQDARRWLLGCPKRLVQIAYKRYAGKPLSETERRYFNRCRQKELQKHQMSFV